MSLKLDLDVILYLQSSHNHLTLFISSSIQILQPFRLCVEHLASMVWSNTHVGSIISSSLDNVFATTWVLPGLYTIVKSYSKNNNNHLAILPKTCGYWPNRPLPYDPHKRQTYCLVGNVWTYAKQNRFLKPLCVLCYNYVLLYLNGRNIHYWLITFLYYIMRQHSPHN
jgi:hypothetical protein